MTEKPKNHAEMCEAGDFILRLKNWLENPEFHLSDKTRTEILELLVLNHIAAVKQAERSKLRAEMLRSRGKDIITLGAVLTLFGSFGPTAWEFISRLFQ